MSGFSSWIKFNDRKALEENDWEFPGVYAIAISEKDISKTKFCYIKEIVYFGVSPENSLKGRLNQFKTTINPKNKSKPHGGAVRFVDNIKGKKWRSQLYVSIMPFTKCDVKSKKANDLKMMGEIVRQEYICLAEYVGKYKELPRFNNENLSPKNKTKKITRY
jgi:hypothetical protein